VTDLYVDAPPLLVRAQRQDAFAAQWEELRRGGSWDLAAPKHEFLRWLVDSSDVLLHGSNRRHVPVFEPRAQTDYADEPTHAVFATSDGIWPIYFAIADRRVVTSLINDCIHDGESARYFFSVATDPEGIDPWTGGLVYVLPREPFTVSHGSAEWTSPTRFGRSRVSRWSPTTSRSSTSFTDTRPASPSQSFTRAYVPDPHRLFGRAIRPA
jgi:hypothetical protein